MSQEEISNKEYIKLHSGGTWVFCAIIVVFALLLHLSIIHEKDFTMPYRLTQIDSVMQTNPQTAMKMLAKDSKYIDDAPDRVSMFYKLLMASTTDRLGMLMKSDSDLINVEKYYEYTKSSDKLIRTYFLIGRINENNGHITKAMLYYQKAADEAGRANMYEVMAEAQNHYIGLMLDGRIPRDSIPSYIKTYKRKAEQIYSERNKLQQDTQTEALVIIVCIIIMIALAIFIVHKHKKEKGKVSSNDLIDRTLNKTPIEGTMKDVTKTLGYPVITEIRKKASQPDFKLPEALWNNFFDEIDSQYAGLCTRLREKLPRISDIELMTCCLTKLGIRNSDMAHLLCRSDNSVSSIRSRLYEKLTGEKGSTRLFDELIQTF